MTWSLRISAAIITGAACLLGFVTPSSAQGPMKDAHSSSQRCVLIDTDIDIDDLRAIPAVIGKRNVVGIIATTGAGQARSAGSALAKLLAEPNDHAIPVIIGATDTTSPLDSLVWLPPVRAAMATANGYLSGPTLAPPYSRRHLLQGVRAATRGCKDIEVLIIGPFSSFVKYSPVIRDRLVRVVMQGMPFKKGASADELALNFNCGYDVQSCKIAFTQVRGHHPAWVEVPSGDPTYQPSLQAVNELRTTGLPGAFRTAYLSTLWTWEPNSLSPGNMSYLWDDSAAMFLISTKGFTKVGHHWEPSMSPAALRAKWVSAVNAWRPQH